MDAKDVLGLIKDGGVIAVLVLILVGGNRAWWVWGWQHRKDAEIFERRMTQTESERDEWKTMALRGTALADRSTDLSAAQLQQIATALTSLAVRDGVTPKPRRRR